MVKILMYIYIYMIEIIIIRLKFYQLYFSNVLNVIIKSENIFKVVNVCRSLIVVKDLIKHYVRFSHV